MEQIKYVENELVSRNDFPNFSAGDTITVHYKIKEGNKAPDFTARDQNGKKVKLSS